jgi:hypothetical protein
LGAQTDFDVAKTGATGQLGESQTEELIPAREFLDVPIALVAIDAKVKLVARDEVQKLRENNSAKIHRLPPVQQEKQ